MSGHGMTDIQTDPPSFIYGSPCTVWNIKFFLINIWKQYKTNFSPTASSHKNPSMPWNIDSVTCRNFINQISQNKQTKKLHAKFSYLYDVDIKFNWDHNQQHHSKQYNTRYHLDSRHNISLMNHMIHME